ncbi:MAG: TonB-dependent receptor plug domain-containing protein, partial [Bacteroidota bacterium]|nr:TonB-dependent receptor plug domain-containing protein [Bacteroidota bacterium]
MKTNYTINLVVALLLIATKLSGQGTLTGKVVDKITKESIPEVSVYNQETLGTITDRAGDFIISLSPGIHKINFTCVAYASLSLEIEVIPDSTIKLGLVELSPYVIGLEEVSIISSVAESRKTPVAVSTINAKKIERELGDKPLPDIMKMTPGVYPTRTGGGSGDAAINIRGFKQDNIAVLLNGIPVSSVENGLVYWNNWLGLADATQSLQVQRGLGASKVALNSVGGTINIITRTTEEQKGGTMRFSATNYGNLKYSFSYSTGKLENGLAITFLGSRLHGSGYVDATYVDAWGYFLSVSKQFGKKHKLVFIALGNPEKHGQRNIMLTQAETDQYGLKFNKDWGSYNGRINNSSENFYHKPHFSLNHYWNISERTFLATSAYFSLGYGGGKWSDSYMTDKQIWDYRNPSQQIDWDAIYENNASNDDTAHLSNGEPVTGWSYNIQTDFLANHIWTGLVSTIEHEINDNFRFMLGVHYRYFTSSLQQKVRDLLGGKYYIDDYSWAIDGVAGRDEIRHVGDIVKVNSGAIINFGNIFGQFEYSNERISAFFAGSLNNSWFQRYDHYNYVSDPYSEIISMPGWDVKAGVNFNLNEFNNIFFNGGYYSRVPYFKYVFGNFTNEPSSNLQNEKIRTVELGYGYHKSATTIHLNAYYTYWEDRSLLANEYSQFLLPVMIMGLDAEHMGIEFEIYQYINKHLKLGALASFGDWKWKNNVEVEVFNRDNVVVDTVAFYADGLYVGDAPMIQFGLSGTYFFLKQFELTANWVYYDKLYADSNPVLRNDPEAKSQSYKIPSYHVLDLHLGFMFKLFKSPAQLNFSCYNVLNNKYIIRGLDGP